LTRITLIGAALFTPLAASMLLKLSALSSSGSEEMVVSRLGDTDSSPAVLPLGRSGSPPSAPAEAASAPVAVSGK